MEEQTGQAIANEVVDIKTGGVTVTTCTTDSSGDCSDSSYSTGKKGTHNFIAKFPSNSKYLLGSSSTVQVTVSRAPTSVTLNFTPLSLVYTQDITFTATVAGNEPGNITFKLDNKKIKEVPLSGSTATILFRNETRPGNYIASALYEPYDNNFADSSDTSALVIEKATVYLFINADKDPSVTGEEVVLTVNVTTDVGVRVPLVAQATLFVDGVETAVANFTSDPPICFATLEVPLEFGSNNLRVDFYNPFDNYENTSAQITHAVLPTTTTTTLSSSGSPSSLGSQVTFQATVQRNLPSSGYVLDSGGVTFIIDGTAVGTVPTVNGVAAFSTSSLVVGNHVAVASFLGTNGELSSTSAPVTQVVTTVTATLLSITPSATVVFGSTVNLLATVSHDGQGNATGTVSFADGGVTFATVPVVNNLAEFVTPVLSVGTHNVTATYSGDSVYPGSTSDGQLVEVEPAETNFALSPTSFSPTSITIPAGQSVVWVGTFDESYIISWTNDKYPFFALLLS